jgi:hypothetical protein
MKTYEIYLHGHPNTIPELFTDDSPEGCEHPINAVREWNRLHREDSALQMVFERSERPVLRWLNGVATPAEGAELWTISHVNWSGDYRLAGRTQTVDVELAVREIR